MKHFNINISVDNNNNVDNTNTNDDDTYDGKISDIKMILSRLGNIITINDRKK